MTPQTDLRPSCTILQALSSHCPAYMHLSSLGSQRIRASGVVLLEAILFGSLLLYFPVSLWLEPDPTSRDPPQVPTWHPPHPRICPLYPVGGFRDLKIPLLTPTADRLA